MSVNYRNITGVDTIPAATSVPSSGTVVVDPNNKNNLNYSGTSPLVNFGTPANTGTVEPVIVDGEAGLGPQNCGFGSTGYAYLFITGFASLPKVNGISLVTQTGSTYTCTLYTDTDCTSINSATNFKIVFAKLVGYSVIVETGSPTVNGVTYNAGDFFNEAQLAPFENRIGFWPPVIIGGSGISLNVTENS